MNPLEPPDLMYLNAAEGWLGLGDWREANEELEKIGPQNRAHPDVLEVRYEVYAKATKWDACVDIAEAIVKLTPERAFGWIRRSFALHETKRSREALEKLLPAMTLFPMDITIRYNLACYECVLGNTGKAKLRLAQAFDLAQKEGCFNEYRLMATEDRDLEPLWGALGEAEV